MSLMRSLKRQFGLGMIEVLVAGLVFALGVLGLSSMQMKAKRTSYDALQRSLATSLARDMVARIRSNPEAIDTYAAITFLGGVTSGSEPSPNCKTATCTATQLANHDLWEWEQALEGASEVSNNTNTGGLTQPSGCIDNNGGLITITIAWEGYEGKTNPTGSDCGESRGLYGAGNVNRKIVVLDTFIEAI
ncbi:MAG TPA: type IV pilus modification protein PilV [Marinagarivorans sp.]